MTLDSAAAAGVRLIVWCHGHQVEPDPADMAARYGNETAVLDWREKLVCSRCGRHGGERNRAAVAAMRIRLSDVAESRAFLKAEHF